MSAPDDEDEEAGAPPPEQAAEHADADADAAHGDDEANDDEAEPDVEDMAEEAGDAAEVEDEAEIEPEAEEADAAPAAPKRAAENTFKPLDEVDVVVEEEAPDSPLPEVAPGGANLFEAAAAVAARDSTSSADPLFDYLLQPRDAYDTSSPLIPPAPAAPLIPSAPPEPVAAPEPEPEQSSASVEAEPREPDEPEPEIAAAAEAPPEPDEAEAAPEEAALETARPEVGESEALEQSDAEPAAEAEAPAPEAAGEAPSASAAALAARPAAQSADPILAFVAPTKGRSLWEDARRRLFRNPAAVASLYVLSVLVLLAALGPLLWVHRVAQIFPDYVGVAPTFADMHLLGTDTEGRDMVARLLFGLRISLLVGLVATSVALGIGVLYGAVAGFLGGAVDELMMRIVDVFYAVPFIFFVIVVMVVWRTDNPLANLMLIFFAIGAVEWLTMARVVRGQTIALRKKEFVEAARAAGARPLDIVVRHIVPNVLGPVVVLATLNIPVIILAESFLSFLGLGVQEPLTSLGKLIADGVKQMQAPWLLISPAILMVITLLALNFIGDGLRDALDPKER
jgi:oligopeptide transport system permease protein